MARRVAAQTHRGFNTGAVPSTSTPTACPVCGETPVVAKGEKRHQVLAAHLEQHRRLCRNFSLGSISGMISLNDSG
jgi:hypothetical protein